MMTRLPGTYCGRGLNHEGETFTGHLVITPAPGRSGYRLRYRATDLDAQKVFHEEESLLGPLSPAPDAPLGLFVVSNNHPCLTPHTQVACATAEGAAETLLFRHGDPAAMDTFREEIALDIWPDGSVGYRYAWGMPGQPVVARSGARMRRLDPQATRPRPAFLRHWRDVQGPDDSHYPGSEELHGIGSPFGRAFETTKLGIHHELLKPGRRTSWPHAESAEDEFVYVVSGHPQAWIDGELWDLEPGDAVGFPSGTGIAHSFLNNTNADVQLLVVGEPSKAENMIVYPLNTQRNTEIKERLWKDAPKRPLGGHDGLPDRLRERLETSRRNS